LTGRTQSRTTRPLRSALITRASPLLRTGPPAHPATVLSPLRFNRLGYSLSDRPPETGTSQYQDAPSPVPCGSRRPGSRRLHAGHHLASKRISARLIPESPKTPRFRCRLRVSARQQRFARARLPGPRLTHPVRLFLIAHHDGLQPTQHEAAWSLPPQGDSEGPRNLHLPHSTTPRTRSYIRSSLRSGHTSAPTGLPADRYHSAGIRGRGSGAAGRREDGVHGGQPPAWLVCLTAVTAVINGLTSWRLAEALSRAEHPVSRRISAALRAEGMSLEQWRVLSLLSDGAGHTMSDIARDVHGCEEPGRGGLTRWATTVAICWRAEVTQRLPRGSAT
jgi:hypothetical protein